MQKKHTLFLVLGLAVLSVVIMGVKQYGYFFSGMRMMNDVYYPEKVMPTEIGVNYEMGMMAEPIPTVATSKIAVDPMIGIMPPYYDDYALDVEERSYQKSSYHSVVVDDVNKYLRGMKEYFSSIGGVVLNSSMNSSDKYQSGSLYVKVPVDKFEESTGRVTEDVKKVIDENVDAYDVTAQVVNTKETVQNLQDQKSLKEAQLKDVKTEVEKKRIEIEISRLESQIKNAQKAEENVAARVEYSSLSITAADSERYFNPNGSGDIRYEFERAWESLKSFFRVASLFAVWVLVYSVVWAPIVWIFNKIVQKLKK